MKSNDYFICLFDFSNKGIKKFFLFHPSTVKAIDFCNIPSLVTLPSKEIYVVYSQLFSKDGESSAISVTGIRDPQSLPRSVGS